MGLNGSVYTFGIEYIRTDVNGADGVSRLPAINNKLSKTSLSAPEQTYLHLIQQDLLLDYKVIQLETNKDTFESITLH